MNNKPRRDKKFAGKRNRPDFKKPVKPGSPSGERKEITRIVGVLRKSGEKWVVESTNRRQRGEYLLHHKNREPLEEGNLIVAEKVKSKSRYGNEAKLIEVLGDINSPRAVSMIAIATHDIPNEFSKEALDEANAAKPVTLDNRVDLREIPLVTIDGPDARDFDDAVFAEPEGEGWHLLVAIADVAHYVKSGSELDKTAFTRGNSTYFPDRVVPMLPEALSNELCSLKPSVDRACMAAHLWLDKSGVLVKWKFVRGVMRSHARLTYEQAQAAMDGNPDETTRPIIESILKPLYGAFRCLLAAREKRGTLELDLPERKVEIVDGKVKNIKIRERLHSHRLIEEFMITANVAAAAQLEGFNASAGSKHIHWAGEKNAENPRPQAKPGICLYRVHDKPTEMKLEGLRGFLDSIGVDLVPERQLHPRFLTQILEKAVGTEHAEVINEMMLRSQSQAIYSPINIGHFGLALAKYAHFTSPIRRYADLVVHRGLIRVCKLGEDGITEREIERLEDIADHISTTERRSSAAERDASDRFITLYMADKVGATFSARISGMARFGLFARLDESGADGIIPLNTLADDYYEYDEKRQMMVGKRTKKTYQLTQRVTVKLTQADRLTGSMALTIVEDVAAKPGEKKPDRPQHRKK